MVNMSKRRECHGDEKISAQGHPLALYKREVKPLQSSNKNTATLKESQRGPVKTSERLKKMYRDVNKVNYEKISEIDKLN